MQGAAQEITYLTPRGNEVTDARLYERMIDEQNNKWLDVRVNTTMEE